MISKNLPCLAAVLGLCCSAAMAAAPDALTPVPLESVTIDDAFWSPKLGQWSTGTINDTFDKFEQYGGFRNFDRVAAGTPGGHSGEPWWDGLIYETIRAAGDFLAKHPDPALHQRVRGFVARISAAAATDPDGFVNTAQQLNGIGYKWSNPPAPGDNHDDDFPHTIYNAGCLMEGAIHLYQATGDTDLLRVATRMANHMCGIMGPAPKLNIIPGHALGEESFVKLYRLYRDEPALKAAVGLPVNEADYLNLAQFWIENRGNTAGRASTGSYNQDDISVFLQPTLQGHAVRSVLLATGMAAAAVENGRADYRETVERWWDNMVSARMYVTGGLGAVAAHEGFGNDHELPHDGYAETCAAVSGGFFSHNMNLLTGKAKYVDILERELYNGALAGVSLAGNTYFYTNPMTSGPGHRRWQWAGAGLGLTPCCPPMFLKLNSALPGMVYATKGNTVHVNLYLGNEAHLQQGGLDLQLKQTTAYPWDGTVTLDVDPAAPSTFAMKFRIPGWAKNPVLRVNGQNVAPAITDGYATINRQWQAGDEVTLSLPMPVERVKSDTRVKADIGHVALMRGPMVYCVEGLDNANANHALLIGAGDSFTATYKPDLLGGVVELEGRAGIVRNTGDALRKDRTTVRAIPFYANKNRGDTTMDVWIPDATPEVIPVTEGTPAASYCNPGDTVAALNDGILPASSDDESIPRMTWWNHKGTNEWAELTYDTPRTISTAGVYWWDERRVGRECRVPESWSIQYFSGGQWLPVQGASAYGVAMDQFNQVTFTPVQTTGIRILAKLQSGWSAGILEMRAGTSFPAVPSASHTFVYDRVTAINDGVIPDASDDETLPRHTFWDHRGTAEWVQLTFSGARRLSALEIYWWDERRVNRDCRVPQSWNVQYLSNGQWLPVQGATGYGTEMDTFNQVAFDEIETTAIRVNAQLQSGWSAGVLEMRVYEPSLLSPAGEWLVSHGFNEDTDMSQDANGDGVSLLTAYALDLDPALNLARSLPAPFLASGNVRLDFRGVREDIHYSAESSTDLKTWTRDDSMVGAPDGSGVRSAILPKSGNRRFIRLSFTRTGD